MTKLSDIPLVFKLHLEPWRIRLNNIQVFFSYLQFESFFYFLYRSKSLSLFLSSLVTRVKKKKEKKKKQSGANHVCQHIFVIAINNHLWYKRRWRGWRKRCGEKCNELSPRLATATARKWWWETFLSSMVISVALFFLADLAKCFWFGFASGQ